MDDGTFPLEQLARQSGVPVATLRRWRRVRLFPNPQGKGRAARYDQRHLLRARVVKKLRQAGQPLLSIRSQLERLSEVELQALLVTHGKGGTAGHGKVEGTDVAMPLLPEPRYPRTNWELVELTRGLVLMVHPETTPALRRLAEHIYQHYGERKGVVDVSAEVVGRAGARA